MESNPSNSNNTNYDAASAWSYNDSTSDTDANISLNSPEALSKIASNVLTDYREQIETTNARDLLPDNVLPSDDDASGLVTEFAADNVRAQLDRELPYLQKSNYVNLTPARYFVLDPEMPFDAGMSERNLTQPDTPEDIDNPTTGKIDGIFVGFSTLEEYDPTHQPDNDSICLTVLDNQARIIFVPLASQLDNIIASTGESDD